MFKHFQYLIINFHERFESSEDRKSDKMFVITCCYVKCYSAYLMCSCTALYKMALCM